jgi:methionyl-tRNA formyltransferase
MKIVLFADKFVGFEITKFIVGNYKNDLCCLVVINKNEIYDFAKFEGITCLLHEEYLSFIDKSSDKFDLGVLAWWPYLINEHVISTARLGFINTHPSFLPYNRGKHYNFWAIVENVPFGVTIHKVDEGVDTGNIVAQEEIEYDWTDNGKSLYEKAQESMVNIFIKIYSHLRLNLNEIVCFPQDSTKGSFHHSSELLSASRIELDKFYTARRILNMLRAKTFDGYPGCWFEDDGKRYEVTISIKQVD